LRGTAAADTYSFGDTCDTKSESDSESWAVSADDHAVNEPGDRDWKLGGV
jgi:hypothetical protein